MHDHKQGNSCDHALEKNDIDDFIITEVIVAGQQVIIPAHMAGIPTAVPQAFLQPIQHVQHISPAHAVFQHPSGHMVLMPRIQRPHV